MKKQKVKSWGEFVNEQYSDDEDEHQGSWYHGGINELDVYKSKYLYVTDDLDEALHYLKLKDGDLYKLKDEYNYLVDWVLGQSEGMIKQEKILQNGGFDNVFELLPPNHENMKHILNFQNFINENLETTDYSGSYDCLRNFILDNNLQQVFKDKYDIPKDEEWYEYTQGEINSDDEIILALIGKDYRLRYDEDADEFIVTKKKTGKLKYKIEQSDDSDILSVLDVYSEYEPRFAVIVNGEIVGGSTYEIDDDNFYNFDMSIGADYQGFGVSKKLINNIIEDAKRLKCHGIKAMVVNNMLFDFLTSNGFDGSDDSGTKYVYKKL